MKDTLQNSLLLKRINNLEISLDSINKSTTLRELKYQINEKQDIISQLNDFYNSAWLKLVIVITLLGILLPIVVQYFQRKSLKDLTDFISKQMNDSFELKIKELKSFNKIEIEESVKDLKDNLKAIEEENKNLLIELDATTYYLQGRTSFEQKKYEISIAEFIKSANLWIVSKRPERSIVQFTNVIRALKQITEKSSLPKIDNVLMKSYLKLTFDDTITSFENNEKKEIYTEKIIEIKTEIERIKNNA